MVLKPKESKSFRPRGGGGTFSNGNTPVAGGNGTGDGIEQKLDSMHQSWIKEHKQTTRDSKHQQSRTKHQSTCKSRLDVVTLDRHYFVTNSARYDNRDVEYVSEPSGYPSHHESHPLSPPASR